MPSADANEPRDDGAPPVDADAGADVDGDTSASEPSTAAVGDDQATTEPAPAEPPKPRRFAWAHRFEPLDIRVFHFLNRTCRGWLGDLVFGYPSWIGSGYILYPLILVVLLIVGADSPLVVTAFFAIVSQAIIGPPVTFVKRRVVKRGRPWARFEHDVKAGRMPDIYTPFERYSANSFPSGHSCSVMSTVVIAAWLYGPWYWLLLLIAVPSAMGRAYIGVHWPSDVAVGATWGVVSTQAVLWLYEVFILELLPDGLKLYPA